MGCEPHPINAGITSGAPVGGDDLATPDRVSLRLVETARRYFPALPAGDDRAERGFRHVLLVLSSYTGLVTGSIVQLNISHGGVPKFAIPEANVGTLGLEGDHQAHPQFHGGPRQAILLIAAEVVDELKSQGFPLFYGALGENITTRGLNFRDLRVGQQFRIGPQVWIEITKVREPCKQLNPYGVGTIQKAIYDKQVKAGNPDSPKWGMSGFYASIVRAGSLRPGDAITLIGEVA